MFYYFLKQRTEQRSSICGALRHVAYPLDTRIPDRILEALRKLEKR